MIGANSQTNIWKDITFLSILVAKNRHIFINSRIFSSQRSRLPVPDTLLWGGAARCSQLPWPLTLRSLCLPWLQYVVNITSETHNSIKFYFWVLYCWSSGDFFPLEMLPLVFRFLWCHYSGRTKSVALNYWLLHQR